MKEELRFYIGIFLWILVIFTVGSMLGFAGGYAIHPHQRTSVEATVKRDDLPQQHIVLHAPEYIKGFNAALESLALLHLEQVLDNTNRTYGQMFKIICERRGIPCTALEIIERQP